MAERRHDTFVAANQMTNAIERVTWMRELDCSRAGWPGHISIRGSAFDSFAGRQCLRSLLRQFPFQSYLGLSADP
jgi:hypothetical protein